ncbi:MAG: hypothetical protein KatS3mg060_0223 [Dehalococcoidia bacterium]|nr:MAG: hypothetical protein KatS3mg060_0223 [Dehalococcoidia bacterium]
MRAVVNIGIGGSDLGPAMAYEALRDFADPGMAVRFVSNVDAADILWALRDLDPEETLVIVSSKTFTTLETLTNARTAREWLVGGIGDPDAVRHHFVAVSTNAAAVAEFGIDTANMVGFWDWVGGRYSVDSAIGLSLMIAIGPERFGELLAGFRAIDEHFRDAPVERNMPVLMGLLGIWYTDFLGAETDAVLPYAQRLARFPAYLQQLDMESNGKQVHLDGPRVDVPDRAGRLGRAGDERPARLLPAHPPGHDAWSRATSSGSAARSRTGSASTTTCSSRTCIAQAEALAFGQDGRGGRAPRAWRRTPVRSATFEGNRPSNDLWPERLTPRVLGKLVALYEHRVFTQGTIWGINSFDQWGVELGKALALAVIPQLQAAEEPPLRHDSSTNALIRRYRALRRGDS